VSLHTWSAFTKTDVGLPAVLQSQHCYCYREAVIL
jgi:hypothetical protein